jgi:hypothetical protein
MKLRLTTILFTTFGLLFGATTFAAAGDVALYLSPDTTTAAFLQVPADDARLAAAKPDRTGWQIVTLPGPFTAYVQSNHTHKDLTVIAGTPIHAAASSSSPVLGIAPQTPPLSIKEPDIDWSTVSYAGPVTVYFKSAAPVAQPAVAAPAVVSPVVSLPVQPTMVTAQPAVATVTASPAQVPQYYYGVLKLRTNPVIDGPINAQYLLYSDKGALVALVDLSEVVLGGPVANYLGKSVKVYGTAYTAKNLPSVVIRGQMLQVN